jgi:hypothetical protein
MRKVLYATAALALICATGANANERTRSNVGAMTGAATGAATGAVIGGPVGAAVGGVAGAAIGAAAAVPHEVRTYVVEHPVDSVDVEGDVSEGYVVPDTVTLHRIPDQPRYGYVYIHDRPVVVRMSSRKVVYEGDRTAMDDDQGMSDDSGTTAAIPGGPPERDIMYVERHRVDPVEIEGEVTTGYVIPDSVELTPIPDDPDYAYVYVDHGPVLVRRDTRKVIWMR